MNASNFDISSLTGESPSGGGSTQGSTTPPTNASFLGLNQMQVNASNSFAASVNLASIQSLVDLLLELPLPTETPQQSGRQQILITPTQEQQHTAQNLEAELYQQHHLSHQLSAPLILAKRQLQELNLSWVNVPINQGNEQYSQQHQMNSYLLSLLQQQDVFGEHVKFPPVSHFPPSGLPQPQSQPIPQPSTVPAAPTAPSTVPQGPQTRSHSHQYWNPFLSEPQSNAPSPATAPPPPALNRYPNQICNNDNSNSSSSFSETPATPGTPTATCVTSYPFPQQSRNTRQLTSENGVATKHQTSVPQTEACKTELKPYQNSVGKEPILVLEKMDMDSANFNLSFNDSLQSYSSLGDRVKSHKRQRSNCATSSVKSERGIKPVNTHFEKTPSKDCKEAASQKRPAKASSPVKSPSLSSQQSSSQQLSSQSLSAPPLEKFEAMLDELFDINKGKKVLKEVSSESDSDDSDEERREKKKVRKTNGESVCENKAVLFDITLQPTTLYHFVGLAAKLKRNHTMQNMSVSKLINLLTVLTQQLAIQSASLKDKRRRSVDGVGDEEEEQEDDNITNSAALMAKFETCCDCCLVALYIMTSKGMSSRVYLEECIEQVIAFLNTTIQQYTAVGAAPSATSPTKKNKSPKKTNNSLSQAGANKKMLLKMYMKWSEVIGCLVELLAMRPGTLTDTLVLSTTRVALGAFFLENLNASSASLSSATQTNEIQLNALRLTTSIFSQYSSHRGMILEEILHSIARLPTSKRGRVVYKVDGEDGSTAAISMFSALLLQLIQSLFTPNECKKDEKGKKTANMEVNAKEKDVEKESKKNQALILRQQYDAALRTAYSFLSTFLRKCCGLSVGSVGGQADSDYKVIFEGLVNDLMTTLYKPNWPAAQLLTQVMIKLCVTNITTSSTKAGSAAKAPAGGANAQLNLKLASLDHLGTICSRFAKELSDIDKVKADVKTSLSNIVNGDLDMSDDLTKRIKKDDEPDEEENEKSPKKSGKNKSKSKSALKKGKEKDDPFENDEILMKEIWKQLLRYCDEEKLYEEKNLFASIWLRESERETEIQQSQNTNSEKPEEPAGRSWQELHDMKVKKFMSLYRNASNPNYGNEEYHVIDSRTAELIIRYIDITFTTTVKLFDSALGHIIAALSTTSNTTMRSRAMKSLSTILNNAPKKYATTLLSRSDLQRATKAALLDPSTSVREATIDLIGKFILNGQSEDLIDKYYDIITERVLDTGVSVRKRVIKILREICLTYPSYKRVPEICSKIIKRINDDGEGIRKLVTETFTTMWFKEEKDREAAKMKVKCINHVVATVLTERIGTEWLQQLLTNLFSSTTTRKSTGDDDDEETRPTPSAQQLQQVTNASAQIVDVLIGDILCGDQQTLDQQQQPNNKSNCVSAMTTIWLFGKVCPHLLVNHISTLQPYLSLKCTTQLDIMIMIKVVQIIEHVLPKLANPSESLLTRIEEDLTKNILQNNAQVLGVCVSCLSSLIHRHTNNRTLAQDLFKKFFSILDFLVKQPNLIQQPANRPKLLRSLFTCGLFAKHFEFLEEKQRLFEIFVKFVSENMPSEENEFKVGDLDILLKALTGLGFMFERNPAFTLKAQTQNIYKPILNASVASIKTDSAIQQYQESAMCQVLKNLTNYLSGELDNEISSQIEWSKENLKTMTSDDGDTNSIQSSIIQLYLSDIVKCTLNPLLSVRRAAVNLIHIIHNGGIVHPLQLVPYLIAMSSDDDYTIRSRADHVLNEIERKYHGFVSMKAKQGVQLSFQLHSYTGKRGYRIESIFQVNNNLPAAQGLAQEQELLITGRLSTLYSVVAGNRQSRRAFVGGLLKYFDLGTSYIGPTYDSMICSSILTLDENVEEAVQQFVCDNIIWLPYSVWDEPLYLLHQLDLTLSLIASQTQSQFKEVLNLEGDDDDEEEVKQEKLLISPKANETIEQEDSKTETSEESKETSFQSESINQQPPSEETGFKANTCHIPSSESVMELLRYLKAFYMLSWCKQLLRELFSITDVKLQDYSPNENQKVWDKAIHRRNVDVRILEKLMNYPTTEITIDSGWERNVILAEYQRFKNLQLTGVDSTLKTVSQLLKEPVPKSKQIQDQVQAPKSYQVYSDDIPDLSREEKEKLIEKIRASDCKVSLIDISANMKSPIKEQSLKMTINTSKRKKKKKEKHKKKKHKKHKFRLASSEEEESESDSSDGDSDYC
ncbi:nipped-B-like protein [Dinothrombium tinctorium]|uniref:Nipped-B protein n=1 Tax=Dinothrombium tinctorium TaxID=1965070 RepID=A0A3S3P9X0_9ACAR|nr:nipped-B-like protein [Dinothrombium tinctorium]RWS10998.1 nipped-B-like protein [Dinothrombium tinctorium]